MENGWSNVIKLYQDNQTAVVIVVGTLVTAWTYVGGISFLSYWRGMMIRKARRLHVQVMLIDKFVSDIEDSVLSGEINREEAIEMYRDLKKSFPIPDLFPATERLKEDIKKRIASGVHTPVDLPPTTTPKPKTMFDKAA